jgi:S1-C subfamily serine protease
MAMTSKGSGLAALCIAVLSSTMQPARAEPISPVVIAEPSVFKVVAYGDVEVSYPSSVDADMKSLHDQFLKAKADGSVGSVTEPQFYWRQVIANPDVYLKASKEMKTWREDRVRYGEGSGFVVSEEGVLLTNAHVVSDEGNEIFGDKYYSLQLLYKALDKDMDKYISYLSSQFGSQYVGTDADYETLVTALLSWLKGYSNARISFRNATVVLKYYKSEKYINFNTLNSIRNSIRKFNYENRSQYNDGQSATTILEDLEATEETEAYEKQVAAEVLAQRGSPFPGDDIAILKLKLPFDYIGTVLFHAPHAHSFVARELRLICVRLGDSDDVMPGSHIYALGFPGVAFDSKTMDEAARYVVNPQGGTVGQPVPLKSGSTAIPITASIDHGDSGGPVVNEQGEAIGITVAVNETRIGDVAIPHSGYAFAVPINIAKRYLNDAKIVPKCSLDGQWQRAAQAYYDKQYGDASIQLRGIALTQATNADLDVHDYLVGSIGRRNYKSYDSIIDITKRMYASSMRMYHPGVSPYVLDLMSKADAKLDASKN